MIGQTLGERGLAHANGPLDNNAAQVVQGHRQVFVRGANDQAAGCLARMH